MKYRTDAQRLYNEAWSLLRMGYKANEITEWAFLEKSYAWKARLTWIERSHGFYFSKWRNFQDRFLRTKDESDLKRADACWMAYFEIEKQDFPCDIPEIRQRWSLDEQ